MSQAKRLKVEFGDFQTPKGLAHDVCALLRSLGISPDVVVEPTCGVGAFVRAAITEFSSAREVIGFEINHSYLSQLRESVSGLAEAEKIRLESADFFSKDWSKEFSAISGSILILGNLPWVTNSALGNFGGSNLPEKSNFLNQVGFDAISGKSNFDISEWMLLEILRCLRGRSADIAMLVKTAVARKVLAHAEKQKIPVQTSSIYGIDAKKNFNAAVDACLLVIRLTDKPGESVYDYTVYETILSKHGKKVGHRCGLIVGDLEAFNSSEFLLGQCPQKWRSGVKHDASSVMELTRSNGSFENGLGETVDIEHDHLFPLLKGSDIGSGKPWREKFVIVTQKFVGERTDFIRQRSPKTWAYLEDHHDFLDSRGSTIYKKNPRFSVFGVGEYAFRPWRIAICSLYKSIRFRLIGPIDGKPVMFDDTVYYLSFESEKEAKETLDLLSSESAMRLLSSLIFWDEKRPIKTSLLNVVDWSKISPVKKSLSQVEMNLTTR